MADNVLPVVHSVISKVSEASPAGSQRLTLLPISAPHQPQVVDPSTGFSGFSVGDSRGVLTEGHRVQVMKGDSLREVGVGCQVGVPLVQCLLSRNQGAELPSVLMAVEAFEDLKSTQYQNVMHVVRRPVGGAP